MLEFYRAVGIRRLGALPRRRSGMGRTGPAVDSGTRRPPVRRLTRTGDVPL